MPYQREAVIVLEMWRAVERAMTEPDIDPDSLERLHADASRLRDEYQRLVAAALEHHRPVPPPFPGGEAVPSRKELDNGQRRGPTPAPDPEAAGA